jgi:hypothetical protein
MGSERVEWMVELVPAVSVRGMGDKGLLILGVAALELFPEAASWVSISLISWPGLRAGARSLSLSFPEPVGSALNRKYLEIPLKPLWTRSPVKLLLSAAVEESGGGERWLKVVRTSRWFAEV